MRQWVLLVAAAALTMVATSRAIAFTPDNGTAPLAAPRPATLAPAHPVLAEGGRRKPLSLPGTSAAASVDPPGWFYLSLHRRVELVLGPGPDAGMPAIGAAIALTTGQGLRGGAVREPLRAWTSLGQLNLAIRLTDRFALMPTYRFPSIGSGPDYERAHRFMLLARWAF